jgi:hypothetical protein
MTCARLTMARERALVNRVRSSVETVEKPPFGVLDKRTRKLTS